MAKYGQQRQTNFLQFFLSFDITFRIRRARRPLIAAATRSSTFSLTTLSCCVGGCSRSASQRSSNDQHNRTKLSKKRWKEERERSSNTQMYILKSCIFGIFKHFIVIWQIDSKSILSGRIQIHYALKWRPNQPSWTFIN